MSGEPGLRERKKQRTRETIARVAVELFSERGYHATTLAEIAEAADVSTRTIFSYFPSKEDILFCDFPDLKDALARALAERPPGTDALEAVRGFVLSLDHRCGATSGPGSRRSRSSSPPQSPRTSTLRRTTCARGSPPPPSSPPSRPSTTEPTARRRRRTRPRSSIP
jgi:AcrR family transcriptional regulator